MKYGLFLGCNMPTHRPDVERAIRLSLDDLGVELSEVPGYVCCPGFGTFPAMDEDARSAVNAWNLSIGDQLGLDLLVQCGSCYSSLRLGRATLEHSVGRKKKVRGLIEKAGKSYSGTSTVRHMTDVLYHDVGTQKIEGSLKHDLEGLHGVVQYPCHTLYPSEEVGFESNAARPHILADLLRSLGATVDSYSCEYMCCGGSGGFYINSKEEALAFTKRKLDAIKSETRADFIVASCITCLLHLDRVQKELNNRDGTYSLPVFDFNQLLALCMGYPKKEVASISMIQRESITDRFAG